MDSFVKSHACIYTSRLKYQKIGRQARNRRRWQMTLQSQEYFATPKNYTHALIRLLRYVKEDGCELTMSYPHCCRIYRHCCIVDGRFISCSLLAPTSCSPEGCCFTFGIPGFHELSLKSHHTNSSRNINAPNILHF